MWCGVDMAIMRINEKNENEYNDTLMLISLSFGLLKLRYIHSPNHLFNVFSHSHLLPLPAPL